jgi:hypothetical protein
LLNIRNFCFGRGCPFGSELSKYVLEIVHCFVNFPLIHFLARALLLSALLRRATCRRISPDVLSSWRISGHVEAGIFVAQASCWS